MMPRANFGEVLTTILVFYATALLANPTAAATFSVIHRFEKRSDGAVPSSRLLYVGGKLYGTTLYGGGTGCQQHLGCGIVYSVTKAGSETVIYRFQGSDGAHPYALPANVGGTLYGITTGGGGYGAGTVYSLTTTGVEKVVYPFGEDVSDGTHPHSALHNLSGTLYGTTEYGGDTNCLADGCGTVYSVTPDGTETVIHAFGGGSDGVFPTSALLLVGTTLYGTTFSGGGSGCNFGCGTVFSISGAGVETVVHAFGSGSDGANPSSGLTNVGGTLFGVTSAGGSDGCGTVYSINSVGVENVVYSFKGRGKKDGCEPDATLLDVGGVLYGTTAGGGSPFRGCNNFGCGTVYAVTMAGVETIVHYFDGDGYGPENALADVGGTLYGTANTGNGVGGIVYTIKP